MELNEQNKAILVKHGVTKRSAQLVVLDFVDMLYDLTTEDREIASLTDVFEHKMHEDDFDEIREECSSSETPVSRKSVSEWIRFDKTTRYACLTEAGRELAAHSFR